MQALIYSLVFVVFICIHELAEMLGFVHFLSRKRKKPVWLRQTTAYSSPQSITTCILCSEPYDDLEFSL